MVSGGSHHQRFEQLEQGNADRTRQATKNVSLVSRAPDAALERAWQEYRRQAELAGKDRPHLLQ